MAVIRQELAKTMSLLRLPLLALMVALSLATSYAPVSAARPVPFGDHVRTVQLCGQITALVGRADNPTGFTLQLKDRSIDIKIAPRTTNIMARSAEAQVDGLAQYDFAVVLATRSSGDWVANRVLYDVVPFGPIRQFTVSGKVLSADKRGRGFTLKLVSGDTHWIRITKNTEYTLDGQAVVSAPSLVRDTAVDVQLRRSMEEQWVAVSINVKTGVSSHAAA